MLLAFHSGHEADHSPLSSAGVCVCVCQRMGGAVPPLPQYAFMAWCLVGGSTATFYLTYNIIAEFVSQGKLVIIVTRPENR
jgi:hypothetical protein